MSKVTEKLFKDSIVINGMAGTTYAFDALLETHQDAAVITLAAHNEDWNRTIELVKNYMAAIIAHPDKLMLVESAEDILRAHESNKLGIIFGTQTSTSIGQDWTNIWLLYKLGVRIMQLTYMNHNMCGDGCMEVEDRGLTYFGQRAIAVMNQVGILVDLSHSGWKTAEDTLKYSQQPVICSHTNPHAVCPIPRNFPDEILKGIAESGGVIGINAHPAICSTRNDGSQPDIQDFMQCMEYMIDLVGIDHVGIGPDLFHGFTKWEEARWHVGGYMLAGEWKTTAGLADEYDVPQIGAELMKRNYSTEDIQKILGLNFLNLFKEVWRKNIFSE